MTNSAEIKRFSEIFYSFGYIYESDKVSTMFNERTV